MRSQSSIDFMVTPPKWLFVLLIFVSGFTILRTFAENRWSDWTFGDAQTMLAVRNWMNEGLSKTHFLWIPQGYSQFAKHFDSPELNHHAHGNTVNKWGHSWTSRAYTHYPSWYAIPFGLFGKLGVFNKTIYQLFALAISFVGLFFLFKWVSLRFGSLLAAVVVLRYVLTPGFLGYADSLANHPLDDCFKFAFLYFWTKCCDRNSLTSLSLAFLSLFLGTLVSFDGLLFCLCFAIGYPVLFYQKIPWGKLAVLSLFPVLALSIQAWQIIGYLGWDVALNDWLGGLRVYSTAELPQTFWHGLLLRFEASWTLLKRSFGVSSSVFFGLIVCVVYFSKLLHLNQRIYLCKALVLFLVGGALYGLVFPIKSQMAYQVRQFYPFLSLLYGVLALCVYWQIRHWIKKGFTPRFSSFLSASALLFCVFAGKLIYTDPFRGALDFPTRARIPGSEKKMLETIANRVEGDRIFLQLGNFLTVLNPYWGHVQVHPLLEYYIDGPVLSFTNTWSLMRDLQVIQALAERSATLFIAYETSYEKDLKASLNRQRVDWQVLESSNELNIRVIQISFL